MISVEAMDKDGVTPECREKYRTQVLIALRSELDSIEYSGLSDSEAANRLNEGRLQEVFIGLPYTQNVITAVDVAEARSK